MKSFKILLLIGLLLTGVTCRKDLAFVYSRLGGETLLPCSTNSTDCSSIFWTFYRGGRFAQEVSRGRVNAGSDKFSRLSVASNCSLGINGLKASDAGSYVCMQDSDPVSDVYLSLLSIASRSTITDLQPGGDLVLSCVLFTYFDAGSCRSYSSGFTLHWLTENGTKLSNSSRIEVIDTRCNVTVTVKLQEEDNNRKWTCQCPQPPVTVCPVQLPISRIVVCAALPLMVIVVGLFTWRLDHRRPKMRAVSIELQQMK
ncbi:uncharacterized protein LOC125013596 [Mugil cephalus]|uniref:uncharacterized protein LOC125013596 n=1 Tax=Mugil cephalus TaxID=48193 RepID=UPI001FB7E722|nr:uncharacterized protein LOC125013596 [Mugil cephalus]